MTSLEIKLASLIAHLVEAHSGQGEPVDLTAARDLLDDPEVSEILTPGPLIPASRSGKSVDEMFALWLISLDY